MQSGARVNACCGVVGLAELCDARRSFRHALPVIAHEKTRQPRATPADESF
jgi:hypothetical protein